MRSGDQLLIFPPETNSISINSSNLENPKLKVGIPRAVLSRAKVEPQVTTNGALSSRS